MAGLKLAERLAKFEPGQRVMSGGTGNHSAVECRISRGLVCGDGAGNGALRCGLEYMGLVGAAGWVSGTGGVLDWQDGIVGNGILNHEKNKT